eukprot:m.547094 g.547094  ORF g.547094 m.547094 type:complete len:178 (-) comp57695_c0_seq15:432-965(-)
MSASERSKGLSASGNNSRGAPSDTSTLVVVALQAASFSSRCCSDRAGFTLAYDWYPTSSSMRKMTVSWVHCASVIDCCTRTKKEREREIERDRESPVSDQFPILKRMRMRPGKLRGYCVASFLVCPRSQQRLNGRASLIFHRDPQRGVALRVDGFKICASSNQLLDDGYPPIGDAGM